MKTDILVIGDGPSAVAAAVTASRMGAKTTLLIRGSERCLGGGLKKRAAFEWRGSASSMIWEEVKERMGDEAQGLCDPNALSAVLHDMVREAKINVVSKSLISVQRSEEGEGSEIEAILTSGKTYPAKRYSSIWIEAKVYIDSTGTAELAREAGVPCENAELQPSDRVPVGLDIRMAVENEWPEDAEMNAQSALVRRLQALMDENGTDFDIDRVTMRRVGEKQAENQRVSLIEAHIAGFTKYSMFMFGWEVDDKISSLVSEYLLSEVEALRGARLVFRQRYDGPDRVSQCRGAYRLTEEDICEGRVFADWVVSGAKCGFDSEILGDALIKTPQYDGREYTIPFRCLLPEGCDNLLLNGRGICATEKARRSISSAPIAFAIGEAAGTAAALAVRNGCAPKNLTTEEIQRERMNRGAKVCKE